jgi:hypothetical protein
MWHGLNQRFRSLLRACLAFCLFILVLILFGWIVESGSTVWRCQGIWIWTIWRTRGFEVIDEPQGCGCRPLALAHSNSDPESVGLPDWQLGQELVSRRHLSTCDEWALTQKGREFVSGLTNFAYGDSYKEQFDGLVKLSKAARTP